MPCPHNWDSTPQWWCCCWVTGPSHWINLPEHLHHTSHGAKAYPVWSHWCTRKEDEAGDAESPKCMSCRTLRRSPKNRLQQRTETTKCTSKESLMPCSQILWQNFHCKSILRRKIPRMREIVKGGIFSRDNVSFHTRHEKWVWSIILAGTHQKRVITSFGHTGCGLVEDSISGCICGIRDASSALFQFIIPRQRCLSWLFVVGIIRRGSGCYLKMRCPCFLGYIFWCQNVSGGCDCCDDG